MSKLPTIDHIPMSARAVHTALSFALRACPTVKADESRAVLVLDGSRVYACDGYVHHTACLPAAVTDEPVKVSRASVAGLCHILNGTLKAAKETDRAATVAWSGLLVRVMLDAEPTEYELERDLASAPADSWRLPEPTDYEPDEVMVLPTDRLAAACWPDECTSGVRWTHSGRAWITHRMADEAGEEVVLGVAVVATPGEKIELVQGVLAFVDTKGHYNTVGEPVSMTISTGDNTVTIDDPGKAARRLRSVRGGK